MLVLSDKHKESNGCSVRLRINTSGGEMQRPIKWEASEVAVDINKDVYSLIQAVKSHLFKDSPKPHIVEFKGLTEPSGKAFSRERDVRMVVFARRKTDSV